MKHLFLAIFDGLGRRNDPNRTDHEIVVRAENEEEALPLAKALFFNHYGGYVRRYAPETMQVIAYSEPRFRSIRKMADDTIFINGEYIEHPATSTQKRPQFT